MEFHDKQPRVVNALQLTGDIVPVITAILAERRRQDAKWGQQSHSPTLWLAILTEEVGEVAEEILRRTREPRAHASLRAELVQVAAVAVAWLECIDRWTAGTGGEG